MSVLCNRMNLQPTKLLCAWDSPGQNTGVRYHASLQRIFWTQGSNPCLLYLLHWPAASFTTSAICEALGQSYHGSAVKNRLQSRRCGFNSCLGKILWRRNDNLLQDVCLGNPMDREAWQVTVHGVTKEIQLSN